jgi:hypothetical protein
MRDEPLARERDPIERVRARLEALVIANAAPRCGARSKRTDGPRRVVSRDQVRRINSEDGVLFFSDPGDPNVSFTRSPKVAAYWALLERDCDEGRESVFIFDRQSLERRYKVKANPGVFWHTNTLFHNEAEEEIWANVIDIGNHLIGFVSGPTDWRSHKHKTLNRKYRARIEARLLLLERQMTFRG